MSMNSKTLLSLALFLAAACGGSSEPAPAAPEPVAEPAATTEPAPAEPAPAPEPAPPPAPPPPPPGPAVVPVEVPPAVQAIVDAKDRTEADRALDAGRHPGELLAFLNIQPGQKVAELIAGGGYTTELLARAVGPKGKVYAQNNKMVLGFAGKAWPERLKRAPFKKNTVRVDRELEDPLPKQAKNLDLVVMNLFYHDLYWVKTDREKMNKAVLAALKPGGLYVIIDHSGRAGTGTTEVQTLHRIEQSEVEKDVTAAGFVLDRQGDFLRNPDDKRDWSASPMDAGEKRGTSDRFVLVFKKP
jgi:predicted methyltransferase